MRPNHSRSFSISFDPFEPSASKILGGEPRGVALALAAGCFAVFVATLAPLVYLLARAPGELALLRVNSAEAWGWADAHKFPLAEAAAQSGRAALAQAFGLQTQLGYIGIGLLGVYFLWRGFANPRPRGWSHFFWLAGVCLVFFAPTLAPKLSPQRVDFAATSWVALATPTHGLATEVSRHRAARSFSLRPGGVLFARSIFAGMVAAFAALALHDAAYRMREALSEFGIFGEEPELEAARGFAPGGGRRGAFEGAANLGDGAGAARQEEAGGFGSRGKTRARAPRDKAKAQAYATLGVTPGASKSEIERAYRAKMKRAHPDHGGSVELAAALNQARDMVLPHG